METVSTIFKKFLLALIWVYSSFISPLYGKSCRHIPTCSQYAREAIIHHGPIKGTYLSITRILRCRPGGTSGYDPVPGDKIEQ